MKQKKLSIGNDPDPERFDKETVLADYRLVIRSRQVSLVGRREVLSGKAKFGIFGDGKELPQVAMAKVFQPGDIRSGYYRDQTLMFALGDYTVQQYFAQLYADADIQREPASGGRQMNAHFGTRLLDENGNWMDQTVTKNSSADVSPTASQMPRLVGLAQASKLYRELDLGDLARNFTKGGNEIAFGTIGNASAAEGIFWESINAISVLQVPALISIWDDDYGISVSNQDQFGKDLAAILAAFGRDEDDRYGFDLYQVKGWDYSSLISVYQQTAELVRKEHRPAIVHVIELTQPQGHSTSGSHERYKSRVRLAWEEEFDCLAKFREWILAKGFADENELTEIDNDERQFVESERKAAWAAYKQPILQDNERLISVLNKNGLLVNGNSQLAGLVAEIQTKQNLLRKDLMEAVGVLLATPNILLDDEARRDLIMYKNSLLEMGRKLFADKLYSQSGRAASRIKEVFPQYSGDNKLLNGFEILNTGFDLIFERDPRVIAFGEDLGRIGGVNQGFSGLQQKYGETRVSDTGIREATIVGQAIGLAMRGLKPIAEIQYLDYLLYGLQILADDLATVHWRSAGTQKAPAIIRTRGHRLEGVWHSGSLMGGYLNLLRGINLLVPRNMVQAIGFYNTLLESDEPGIVVEVLNAYRKKERLPDNLQNLRVPVGVPEVIRIGTDVTLVTYGAMCAIALEAAETLQELEVSLEVVDVRSLLPFDTEGIILTSLEKTNRIIFADEDFPGGASAYMMQKVVEGQGGFAYLDAAPETITAAEHRPPYGSDGNYFSKPNRESMVERVYGMLHAAQPSKYPWRFS